MTTHYDANGEVIRTDWMMIRSVVGTLEQTFQWSLQTAVSAFPSYPRSLYNSSEGAQAPPGIESGAKWWNGATPSEPPPGLVRPGPMMSTYSPFSQQQQQVSPPRRHISNDDVSMFHDVEPYLETGHDACGNDVTLGLTCQICADRMLEVPARVSPFPHLLSTDLEDPRNEHLSEVIEHMAVLPCGHFFGSLCLGHYIALKSNADEVPECPLCRFPLLYRACRHIVHPKIFDTAYTRREQLPRTIPEGGRVSRFCADCDIEEAQMASEYLGDILYPRDTHPFDYCPDSVYAQGFNPRSMVNVHRGRFESDMGSIYQWGLEQRLRW